MPKLDSRGIMLSSYDAAFIRVAMKRILNERRPCVGESLIGEDQANAAFARWVKLGRPRPTTVTRFADEVAQTWVYGDVCCLKGGAVGFEAEISHVPLAQTANYGYGDVLVNSRTLDLKLDSHLNRPILEIVTKPIGVLPGDADRSSEQDVFKEVNDVLKKLNSSADIQLKALFSGNPYHPDVMADGVRILGPQGPTRLNVHYTVGISLARFSKLMQYTLAHGSFHAGPPAANARRHATSALEFAKSTSSNLTSHNWVSHDGDCSALEGFLALTYIQFAALAQGIKTAMALTKNFAAALSRIDLSQVRNGLIPTVRDYLDANSDELMIAISRYFREDPPAGRNSWLDCTATNAQNAPALKEYLKSAFSSSPARPNMQETVFGAMHVLKELDCNRDAFGTQRLDPPLLIVELRHHAPTTSSIGELHKQFKELKTAIVGIETDAQPRTSESRESVQSHAPGSAGSVPFTPERPVTIQFRKGARKVPDINVEQQAELNSLARRLLEAASATVVVVRVEGGGNGGWVSHGADDVGERRASTVATVLRSEINRLNESLGQSITIQTSTRGNGQSQAPDYTGGMDNDSQRRQVVIWRS